MASQFLNDTLKEKSASDVFRSLLKSWFNCSRSTTNMVTGAKNEDAVLMAFSQNPLVLKVFSCGLFECTGFPWLAASPDAIAVLRNEDENLECGVAVVEVKTRTTEQTIAEAEDIAAKYNHKYITCVVLNEVWNEVIPKDHSNQILLQLLVTGLYYCCYICARPGTS